MIKIKFLTAILFLCVTAVIAQESVNDYKYIIVPIQYDFQKSEDAYQVNSLTKFLFNKAGYEAYLSNEVFPEDLKMNRCLSLTAKLIDNSKMFSTKMNFDLVDCNNNVIFSSVEGKSKEKEYKKAYHECLRESFEGIARQNYAYNGGASAVISVGVTTEVVGDPIEIQESTNTVPVTSKPVDNTASNKVIPIATTAVVANEVFLSNNIEEVEIEKVAVVSDVLYAQPNANGFQIVDSTPKVIYTLLKTAVSDVYLLKGHSAIVFKDIDTWKVEYYENGGLVTKVLNLKFF